MAIYIVHCDFIFLRYVNISYFMKIKEKANCIKLYLKAK
jgi:hypothetical protein